MASSKNVVSRFLSSSITFTGPDQSGSNPGQPQGNPKPGQKPIPMDPKQKAELDRLKKKKELMTKPIDRKIVQLTDQQKRMQQKQAAPATAPTTNANPNDDPADLYGQVRPLLSKMGLQNSVINNKTQLMMGQTEGKNSLYCVYVRRQESITQDMISRIKRNESNFKEMKWTADAISVYVWYPYSATPAAIAPVAPPGAPGAP